MSDNSEIPEVAVVNFDSTPPLQVIEYDNLISKFVPGYEVIFQLALAHLRTVLPAKANLLIVGAGSGKELVTFGQAMPDWTLQGVDPSAHMLAIARQKIDHYKLNITIHNGLVADLSPTPQFDAATCILVMHFLPDNGAKLALLTSIVERLKGGASFILLDIYGEPAQVKEFGPAWINHGQQMGLPLEVLQNLEKNHEKMYPISETRTLQLLEQAGFENVRRFYTAYIYSGWIATTKNR